MLATAALNVIPTLLKTVQKAVPDKDLAAQLQKDIVLSAVRLLEKAVEAKTVPWMDGLAKILIIFFLGLVKLGRPVGGVALVALAAYMHAKGVEMPGWLTALMASVFPGWAAARTVEKVKRVNQKEALEWSDLD